MPRRKDHARNLNHTHMLLRRGRLMALRGRRIRCIAFRWRVRRRSRVERRHRGRLLTATTTTYLAASAGATSVWRIGALGLARVALIVLAATRAPLVALVALVGIASALLRWRLGIVLVALASALATLLLVLLAALAALAIRLGRRIRRGGRVDSVWLAAALLISPLRTLPGGVAIRRIGLRWALLARLLLRILWLARLAASLGAALALAAATTRRVRYDAAHAATLRASSCWLLAARRGGRRLGACARRRSRGRLLRSLRR